MYILVTLFTSWKTHSCSFIPHVVGPVNVDAMSSEVNNTTNKGKFQGPVSPAGYYIKRA